MEEILLKKNKKPLFILPRAITYWIVLYGALNWRGCAGGRRIAVEDSTKPSCCARQHLKCGACPKSQIPVTAQEVSTTIIPILQIRKPRHNQIKQCIRGHRATQQRSCGFNTTLCL